MRSICALIALAAIVLALDARAGQPGGKADGPRAGLIEQILEHATELNLTADQKTKLEALQKENVAKLGENMREKMKNDPAAREVMKEMREARQSGDEAKIAAAREKVKEKLGADGLPGAGKPGEGGGDMREKLQKILTPEQMVKVKEIMENNRGKMREGGPRGKGGESKEEKGQKPDPTKEPPKVFDN